MKFRPQNGKAVFLRDGLDGEKVVGGIIIPETAQEKPITGKILAVAPADPDRPNDVQAGDRVLVGKYSGIPVSIEGQGVEIINLTDVLGIL